MSGQIEPTTLVQDGQTSWDRQTSWLADTEQLAQALVRHGHIDPLLSSSRTVFVACPPRWADGLVAGRAPEVDSIYSMTMDEMLAATTSRLTYRPDLGGFLAEGAIAYLVSYYGVEL